MKTTILLTTALLTSSLLIGCVSTPAGKITMTDINSNEGRGGEQSRVTKAQAGQYDLQRDQERKEREHQCEQQKKKSARWNSIMNTVENIRETVTGETSKRRSKDVITSKC